MSRSAIATAQTTSPVVAVGKMIPVGVTSRRYGCNLRQDGNTITMTGQGYYLINASITVTPSVAGKVTVTAQKDGADIIGATASATVSAAGDLTDLNIVAIARNVCACDTSNLSFVVGDSAVIVNNMAVTVVKL